VDFFTDWAAQLTVLLLAAVAAAAASVGIWAARSGWHWFWQALAVWGCVAVLLPIRVYEPAMLLAVGLPVLVGLLKWRRLYEWVVGRGKRRGLRFGLADLGLAILIVALSLAVARELAGAAPEVTAYAILVPAALFAVLGALSYWIAVGPKRRWAIAGAMIVVPVAAWLVFPSVKWLLDIEPLGLSFYLVLGDRAAYWRGFAVTLLLMSLFVVFLVGVNHAARAKECAQSRFTQVVYWTSLTGVLLLFIGLYIALLRLTPFPAPMVSNDDQGRQIMQIVEQVGALNGTTSIGGSPATLSSLSAEKAAQLSPLYDELQRLLGRTNSMPFDPEADSTDLFFRTTNADRISALRDTGRCFAAEWREANAKGDRQRSLDMTIGCLRLGITWCRNSIMVDCLVGHALIGMSNAHLIERRKSFTPGEAEQVIAAIRRAEAEHESIERIIERDVAFCERAFGWQARFSRVMDFRGENEDSSKSVREIVERWRALSRLLMTDLAIQSFQREHDSNPRELGELVPRYLEAMPIDPFSGQPLVYRLTEDGFVLYSVGKDGKDDGGRFPSGMDYLKDGFDLDVEARSRVASGS
jgi:hypothetical protein